MYTFVSFRYILTALGVACLSSQVKCNFCELLYCALYFYGK